MKEKKLLKMKSAYLILAHKNPEQISILIKELIAADSFVLLHIDKKSDIFPERFYEEKVPNLWVCKDRIDVNWAGFSQIKATLALIKLLYELSLNVDYVHLISGQDFVIKSRDTIHSFFQDNLGKNYIDCRSIPVNDIKKFRGNLDKIEYFWEVDKLGNDVAFQMFEKQKENNKKRTFPKGYRPYCGSQWWSLHIDCILYIYQSCIPGSVLYDFYENTYVPDEMYFQTVIMNSNFKDTVIPNNYRYIEWINEIGRSSVLTKKDYFKLVESPCFFARKFDTDVDRSIIDYLSTYINNRRVNS